MSAGDSDRDVGREYFLSLDRQWIRYEKDFWATFRVRVVDVSPERPHGFEYSLSLHGEKDDRVLGYNNAHGVDVASGPARRSKRPTPFDHINRRGRKAVPYVFTTPYKLLEDFFADVDEILKRGRAVTRRILHIGVASKTYIHKRMLAIAKGELRQLPSDPRVWFTSFEALARVFSKQNMMLIEILREKDLDSITALADAAGREKTNVVRSLKVLEEFEIIEYQEGAGGRRAPRLKYDDFQPRVYPRGRSVH